MKSTKEQVRDLLADLSDDCTLEDVQYHLYVIAKIHSSILAAEQQGVIAQDVVEREVGAWLSR